MKYIPIPGDGNCLFSSISYGISKHFRFGITLRHSAVQYIIDHIDEFKYYIDTDIKTYLYNMYKSGTFGDELTIRAIANVFNIKINVWDIHTEKLISSYTRNDNTFNKIINLYYDKHKLHYDIIIE
jgi:glutaminase